MDIKKKCERTLSSRVCCEYFRCNCGLRKAWNVSDKENNIYRKGERKGGNKPIKREKTQST